MKRTNFVIKLVTILLFVAMVAYLGVYLVRSLSSDYRTAPAVYLEINDAASMSGVIIRDEDYIQSSEQFLSVNAENGSEIAVGDTIAVAYSSEDALSRAGQIQELELKEQYISSAISGSSAGSPLTQREGSVNYAVEKLTAAVARHETNDIPSASLNLTSLVFDGGSSATEDDLKNIQNQIASLKQSSARDTKTIAAAESGIFCSTTDGFEYLKKDDLSSLTPSSLKELSDKAETVPENVRGKLISSTAWYYAAAMDTKSASKLKVNDWASLDFGRYCSSDIRGCVISKGKEENGKCMVVFRCASSLSDMMTVRFADADIIFNTTSGLRVPKKACYTDDDGTYVFVSTGIQAEKKYINVLKDMDEYYLVEIAPEDDALKENNNIIITSRKITDGMLLS